MVRDTIGNYLHRTRVLKWIIDSGFDLALFGKWWDNHPLFNRYARGELNHGEELAQVYNTSKVNIHVHPYTTTHQRVFESIGSGGFMLIKHISPHKALSPLEEYLQEGEGYVFFTDQKDMEKKRTWVSCFPRRSSDAKTLVSVC